MPKIVVLDTETTGLDPAKGHRIIEISMLTYDLETEGLLDSYVQRFDPERPIDAGAQAVHGISYEELAGCPKFRDEAQKVFDRIDRADIMVAHNLAFDAPFIGMELIGAGLTIPTVAGLCTMTEGRWACPDGKQPKLSELCFALGVEYDPSKAHGAEYDTQVTAECFFRGLARGFYELPNIYKELEVAA